MSGIHADTRMPVLFVGHGSPMNAIEDSSFRQNWAEAARQIPRPRAVLCVSAHWETRGVAVTSSEHPPTIHDFYGFPPALFEVRYPAPGDPDLANEIAPLLVGTPVALDPERGLDHGSWSVLTSMYPEANVPVLQLSLDSSQPGAFHYSLGRNLAPLRNRGVLVLGSGDIVHNLRTVDFDRADGYDWAVRFAGEVRKRILARDHADLVDYGRLGSDAHLAVPTPEHYLPLLYCLGLQEDGDAVAFFNDEVVLGSVSMTCVRIG